MRSSRKLSTDVPVRASLPFVTHNQIMTAEHQKTALVVNRLILLFLYFVRANVSKQICLHIAFVVVVSPLWKYRADSMTFLSYAPCYSFIAIQFFFKLNYVILSSSMITCENLKCVVIFLHTWYPWCRPTWGKIFVQICSNDSLIWAYMYNN